MIPHNLPTLGREESDAAQRVIASNWLAQGKEVNEFESEFCSFLGIADGHAVAVSSGTAAIYMALWALYAQNKNIAIPAYVCSSLRHAIGMIDGNENIIDVGVNSPNINIEKLEQANPDIAIIPHMFGLPVDFSKLKNIKIIEDCAQSLGAKINGVSTGLVGDIGIFSFYATKLITSGGQGGMIVSKNIDFINEIKDYREFDCRRDHKKRFNFQMTDLNACIGRVQLKKVNKFIKTRETIFQRYKQAGIELIDSCEFEPVRYRAVMRTKNPTDIIKSLNRAGITAIIPIEDWELLGQLPIALNLSRSTVSLPIYPSLANDDLEKIINIVR